MHRAAARTAVPWKNGGGVTREVAVYPAGSPLEGFDWRVSIAEIRSSGPFSAFPGIERLMAVLSGKLSFRASGRATQLLAAGSSPLRFPGELAVDASPLDGAVTDLNVMTRTARCRAELKCHALDAVLPLRLEAPLTIIITLAPARLKAGGGQFELEALDAVELSGLAGCELAAAPGQPGRIYVAAILPAAPP